MSKYLSVKYLLISKQTGTLAWAVEKIDFWGVPEVWHPQTMSNICLLNIYWYQKISSTLASLSCSNIWFFLAPFWGFPVELPQNISGDEIAFAAQQLYTKIRFRCVVVQEKKSVRKKGQKKEINLIAAKSGLVGMKGYLETYNHMKYFLLYLSRFWLRPLFTSNLRGGFRVLKPKSRDLLPRNCVQTYNSLISNCCQNFMQLDKTVLEL